MPVDWSKYPDNWKEITKAIRYGRAKLRCEVYENGKRCTARHMQPHPITGAKVILAVAHLDHDTTHNDWKNLKAMCQLHHNRHDAEFRKANRLRTLAKNTPKAIKAYYEALGMPYELPERYKQPAETRNDSKRRKSVRSRKKRVSTRPTKRAG